MKRKEGMCFTVYILSDDHRCGAENVVATLDRRRVVALLDGFFARDHYAKDYADEIRESLQEVLNDPTMIESRSPILLANDGGGIQLHIVPVEDGSGAGP